MDFRRIAIQYDKLDIVFTSLTYLVFIYEALELV